MSDAPTTPLTRQQKIIDALALTVVLLVTGIVCYAFWRWNAVRDARIAVEHDHAAAVLRCKQACERRP